MKVVSHLWGEIAHIYSSILKVVLRSLIIYRLFTIFCTIKAMKLLKSYSNNKVTENQISH